MNDEMPEAAPDIAPGTDIEISDETAAFLLEGGRLEERSGADAQSEPTVETPDELGGAGGDQPGGVG
jgi:hypothetical protein